MKFFKEGLRQLQSAPHTRDFRAARQKKRREEIEFWVRLATPILTLLAVVVAIYQAELATSTTDSLLKASLRQQITSDRKDDKILRGLASEVIRETTNLPSSVWLSPNASEDEFNEGKRNTLALVQALTNKIDHAGAEISDPFYWELISLAERSFSADVDFEITASNLPEEGNLASRKAALKMALQQSTLDIRETLEDVSHTLDARLLSEIDRVNR